MNARIESTPADATSAGRSELTNALRFLAIDAVEAANSGHPGMPMGMAEIAEVLWRGHLKHNPADPIWPDRDRFVLSNGHGSMLLYALLHLTGYALPIEELKRFRQLHSQGLPATPSAALPREWKPPPVRSDRGSPMRSEWRSAEQLLAAEFNRPGHTIVDHRTWDSSAMVALWKASSHEACSLAGTSACRSWSPSTMTMASTSMAVWNIGLPMTHRVRFEAYGWRVIRDVAA